MPRPLLSVTSRIRPRHRTGMIALGWWGLLLLSISTAHGKTLAVEAPIDEVTVFSDRATVTRLIETNLPAGSHTLALSGLPANLLQDSIEVQGQTGDQTGTGLTIGSVKLQKVFLTEAAQDKERELRAAIQELRDRQQGLKDTISALQVQLDFIKNIGQKMPDTINERIVAGDLDPEGWRKAWKQLGTGAEEIYEKLRATQIDKRKLDAQIEQKAQELDQVRTNRKETYTARVGVESARDAQVALRLSYQVPGASWQPYYEARLDSERGRIRLEQSGKVRQQTGEAWEDVRLTLSTARPARGTAMPELDSWFVDFRQPPGLKRDKAKVMEEQARALADAQVPAKPKEADVVTTEFAAEYRIAGRVDVPADNAPHQYTIRQWASEAQLAARAVPKRNRHAYIYAQFENTQKDPLLPGRVSLYHDGSFTGEGHLDLLPPGKQRKLSFGIDDKVGIEYRLTTGERSREGLINKRNKEVRRYHIAVTSHHGRPLDITILDQIPVPRDEQIEVTMLDDATTPTETDWEDRKGVLAWRYTYQPDEKRVIDFGYQVTYPSDKELPRF